MHKCKVKWPLLMWNGVVYSKVVDRIIDHWTKLNETLDNFSVQHVVSEIFLEL